VFHLNDKTNAHMRIGLVEPKSERAMPAVKTISRSLLLCLAMSSACLGSGHTRNLSASVDRLAGNAGLGDSVDGQRLLKYVVECALPRSDRLLTSYQGRDVVLEGSVGLASDWKRHALSEIDQRWLSACILSRINAFGATVQLSLRGAHPALQKSVTLEESRNFGFQEGAFYGNLFANPPAIYACRGAGGLKRARAKEQRVCTEASQDDSQTSRCGIVLTGGCSQACSSRDAQQGFFTHCAGGGQSYSEVVTVFLKTE
jgi:hypothetical protein